ncbi:hypothetical protein LIER_05424 [Lithospermum erythrorhizon]|uniref:Uncharacterized protein n=1 Tax=Lithospermum erythrorhizon TaxID=34254 RepID=A0AAV3P1D9_LITER
MTGQSDISRNRENSEDPGNTPQKMKVGNLPPGEVRQESWRTPGELKWGEDQSPAQELHVSERNRKADLLR